MTAAPVIEIDRVTFGYPPEPAAEPVLTDVSLRVMPDDFVGIIGPNGGGKTTLLKLMLGLLRPGRGTVKVLGRSPEEVRSQIGYVPQQAWLDASVPADVLDVVLMGRLARSSWGFRYGKAHIDAAMAALKLTETESFARRPIGTLSGGQRQRVLIARALACDARILLLDEPTTGVDLHIERGLTDLLHRLNEKIPIVLVSHDVSFVSAHLKTVACVNRRLTCHPAAQITSEIISDMYHGDLRWIEHDDGCPLADPGCEQHHHAHAPGTPHQHHHHSTDHKH